jgi:ATPase family associated with various cellular activities (AAA)
MSRSDNFGAMKLPITHEEAENWVRKGRELWQGGKRYVGISSRVLRDLQRARNGGPVAKLAAGVSIAGLAIDAAFPELTVEEELAREGYHPIKTPIGGFLCNLIEGRGTPTRTLERKGSDQVVKIWEANASGVAVVYYRRRYEAGPFILAGDDSLLLDTTLTVVWDQGRDLMLERASGNRLRRGDGRYTLAPIPDPGPYIGQPGPEHWAERLERYGDRPRTVLIKGPSGVGKSVMARHIGRLVTGGEARTLRVTGKVLRDFRSSELRDIARFLQPSVLLLDDLDVKKKSQGYVTKVTMLDALLDMLETLRIKGCLVIATKMEDVPVGDPRRAEHYVQGMRPGRVDEVVVISMPDDKKRDEILRHYYGEYGIETPDQRGQRAIVRMTKGLTGAYLREVVERIQVHGVDNVKPEIVNVLQTAPKLKNPKRGGAFIAFAQRTGKPEKMSVKLRKSAVKDERKAKRLFLQIQRLELSAEERRQKADEHEAREKAREAKAKKKPPKRRAAKKKPADELSATLTELSDHLDGQAKAAKRSRPTKSRGTIRKKTVKPKPRRRTAKKPKPKRRS